MTSASAAQPRGPGALLRDRTFGLFFVGKVLSSSGVWVQNIAAAVLMFDLTGSAFAVGLVSVLQFAGPLLFSLWAGALTDRLNRRKMLMAGRLLSAAAVGCLAVLLIALGTDGFGGPPVLLVAVFVLGLGLSLSSPAMQALVPALVPDEDLEQALALNSVGPSIARSVGPAIGAGLLYVGGPALAFGVAALSHGAFAAALAFIREKPRAPVTTRPKLLGGVTYLVEDRKTALLLVGVAALGLGADSVVTLTPPLAEMLGGGSDMVGFLAAAFGVGAVVATTLLRRVRRYVTLRRASMAGFWAVAAGLAISALAPDINVAIAGFLVSGAGYMLATVALNTRIQRRVPDELRGRIMALWTVAFLGSRPFAAALNGGVADLTSARTAMLIAAVLTCLASVFARVRYRPSGTSA